MRGKRNDNFLFTRDGKPVKDFRRIWEKTITDLGIAKWEMHCLWCGNEVQELGEISCKNCNETTYGVRTFALRTHDIRRTNTSNHRRDGTDEKTIMLLGGWRTANTFKRYSIVDSRGPDSCVQRREQAQKALRAEKDMCTAKYTQPDWNASGAAV